MDFYHHLNNLNRSFGGDYCTSGCCSCGPYEAVGNIYHNDVFLGVGKTFRRPNSATFLQPFVNFPFASSFKSQGVKMASSFGAPFTSAQWEELERQVLIYKYMLSSVKIPPDLLFPKPTPLETFSPLYNVRYSKYGDVEPGRCRRTDGKKWRCSKLAAPNQRYCEHHMKRGRSRKLVESKNNGSKKTRVQQITEPTLFSFKAETDLSKGTDRDLFVLDSAKQQWEPVVDTKMGIGNEGHSVYGYGIGGPDLNNRDCVDVFSYYSNVDSAPEIDYSTTDFTNVWSNCEYSPSLDLSMAIAAGGLLDQEMGNIQLESGIEDCNVDNHSRVLDPVWFNPFGPLGEVMHPGSVPDYDSHSVMSSNPATSPVFEKTVFTHSDESVCNSPTLAAIPTEVTFNWLT